MASLADLTLNPHTRNIVEAYVRTPAQSLLLHGKAGVGLKTLASALAENLTEHPTDRLLILPNEKGTIPIEHIRKLYVDTRDVRSSHQYIILDDCDAMSFDAQNAFLKLLEEPNDRVHFILTTHHPESLLPTILSRVQSIEVRSIDQKASQSLLAQYAVSNEMTAKQSLFIATGKPAELMRLISDKTYFEERAHMVRLARDFLSARTYERIACVGKVANRQDALLFLDFLVTIIQTMGSREKSLLKPALSQAIEQATERIEGNGHVKTQLINLALRV